MEREHIFTVILLIFFILLIVQGASWVETDGYGSQWGSTGTDKSPGKTPRNNIFNRWNKQCSGM